MMVSSNWLRFFRSIPVGLAALFTGCVSHQTIASNTRPDYAVPQVMKRQIRNAVDAGDGDYAARALREKLAANPDDLTSRLKLAERYQQDGFPDLALEHYRIAMTRFPDNAEVASRLAKTLRGLEQLPAATEVLVKFCKNGGRPTPELLSLLGILQDDSGQFKDAERAHRDALKLAPSLAYLHNNLGYNLLLQHKPNDAAAEFLRALAIEPRSQFARNNLGLALAAQSAAGEAPLKEALLHWESVAGPATAHNNLASVLMEKGQYEAARKELAIALGYQRNHPAALANLQLLSELDGKGATVPGTETARTASFWGRFKLSFEKVFLGSPKEKTAADQTASTQQ
jgi:Flp pilus assembly protein TadD